MVDRLKDLDHGYSDYETITEPSDGDPADTEPGKPEGGNTEPGQSDNENTHCVSDPCGNTEEGNSAQPESDDEPTEHYHTTDPDAVTEPYAFNHKGRIARPRNWREQCHKDKDFCKKFLFWVSKHGKLNLIFGSEIPEMLEKDAIACKNECKDLRGKEGFYECWIGCRMTKRFEHHEMRAANEARDRGSRGVWIAAGTLLLLIVAIAGYLFCRTKGKTKQKNSLSMKSIKASNSKASGKYRIASRQSTKKSTKRSLGSKVGGKSRRSKSGHSKGTLKK